MKRNWKSKKWTKKNSDYDDQVGFAEVSESGGYTYDTSLVALHSYLGNVEDTHNRLAFLDGDAVLTLPLLYLEGVVLFPEATIPLRVTIPNYIAGVERAMRQVDTPLIIGIVRVYRDNNQGIRFSKTGTTAEIRQFRHLDDGSVNVVARGKQRFRLTRRAKIDEEGALCGEVHIIDEDLPLRIPCEAVGKLSPLRSSCTGDILQGTSLKSSQLDQYSSEEGNDFDAMFDGSFEAELSSGERRLHRSVIASCHSSGVYDDSVSSEDERSPEGNHTRSIESAYDNEIADTSQRVGKMAFSDLQPHNKIRRGMCSIRHLHDVSCAFLPSWVYRTYDSYLLAQKAADRWNLVIKAPTMDSSVTKPDLLSFHIASKIPVSESTRQKLLDIDGTSYRLRREIELLESFDKLRCKTCKSLIAKRSDVLVMSSDGPLGAYANPHCFVHEVMTLYKTDGIGVTGPPVKEYSWFPGYAWSIAECMRCGNQLGWYFSATMKKMRPQAFWGVRSFKVVDEFESKTAVQSS